MEPLKTLFKLSEITSKATSERGLLIEFFVDNVKDIKGKNYKPSFIALKLSHLSLSDLYFMKSTAIEYEKKGKEIGKYFWGSLKSVDK